MSRFPARRTVARIKDRRLWRFPMATVMQHEELVRRALAYIVERRRKCPGTDTAELLDSAGARFNLSPLDQEALAHLLEQRTDEACA